MKLKEPRKLRRIFGKKKGFTLVEVLIVIVIIGVLSGLLVTSAVGAIDKAEATKIVSDLKNIQSASVLYFADSSRWPSGDITVVNPYLSAKLSADGDYSLINDGNSAARVRYHNAGIGASVMSKLKDMQDKGTSISVDVLGKSVEIAAND